MHYLKYSIFGLLSIVCLSCNDDNEPVTPPTNSSSIGQAAIEQSATASRAFASAYSIIEREALQRYLFAGDADVARASVTPSCGVVRVQTSANNTFPATLSITYDEPCRDNAGRTLAGNVVATFNGPYGQRDASIAIAFNDFFFEGNKLSGNLRIVQLSKDAEGNMRFKADLVAGTLTDTDGTRFTLDESRTGTQIAGASTTYQSAGMPGLIDDVWQESRIATFTNSEDQTFAITSTDALTRKADCTYYVAGRIRMVSPELTGEAELDYGDGACDRSAMIFYNGASIQVEL